MQVHSFLEKDSETFTHVLADATQRVCAVIDPVLDFDYASGTTSTHSIDEVIEFIQQHNWKLHYIIETHAHADHLSSAHYLKQQLGGQIVIGKHITLIQETFKEVFNLDIRFKTDASQFDILTEESTRLQLGDIEITALHVPGHTPADMAYLAEYTNPKTPETDKQSAIFIGDTLFAPDVGTARCDFPKGDAKTLYHSIQRLLNFPQDTKLYFCHDYPPTQRDYQAYSTVAEQKQTNKHIKEGISEAEFVKMREARDATLSMPRLILPAIQVNIQAGELPPAEDNGTRYLKVPLNYFI